jgi:hypothetical protein
LVIEYAVKKLLFPACEATIVAVPTPSKVTTLPEIEIRFVLGVEYLTPNPLEALAPKFVINPLP